MTQVNELMVKFAGSQKENITVTSILIALSIPFLWSTWGTGWFTDDYEYLLLYQTKIELGTSLFSDLFLFQPNKHIAPVFNLINLMLLAIGKTANGVHLIISIVYIGSGVVVYKISHAICKDKSKAILAAAVFILSYDLSIKSLVLNVFHPSATNTFTGLLALLYSIKYLTLGRSKNLILASIWLLLTIFNYESGVIFVVIIGLYAIFQWFNNSIAERHRVMGLIGSLIFSAFLFAGFSFMLTGQFSPIYSNLTGSGAVVSAKERSFSNLDKTADLLAEQLKLETHQMVTNQHWTDSDPQKNDKGVDFMKSKDESEIDEDGELINFLRDTRSTYAPRTVVVRLFRFADIIVKTLNISSVDTFAKPFLVERSKTSIRRYINKKTVIVAIAVVVVLAMGYLFFAYRIVDRQTKPFLLIFLVSAACFSVIYNRSDIANSLAALSSIVVSNLTVAGWVKRRTFYYIPALLPAIAISGGACINIATGFNLIYPFDKGVMMESSAVVDEINKALGGYKENVYLLVHEQSILSTPWINDQVFTENEEYSHANISYYREEFSRTSIGEYYLSRTMLEFLESRELNDNVKAMTVKSKPDPQTIKKFESVELIYVNENDGVEKLKVI